ncbi:MAG: amidohydrolase family protein, partial [Myxococcales bacterium]
MNEAKVELPLAGLDDAEGTWSRALAGAFDAHVHLFPDRLFEAIWRWFDQHAWPIRYRLTSEQVIEHLATRGVKRMVGLHYAHKPGIAEGLNAYVLGLAKRFPEVIPFATVLPGEPGAKEILKRALGEGARGVKLHCHVQKMPPDDPGILEACEVLQAHRAPLVIHSGKEPSSPAYGIDCRALCDTSAMERVLQRFPELTVVVAHLGADEYAGYEALLGRYPNLYLDTAMVVGEYFPGSIAGGGDPVAMVERNADRILYGSDFPNLPYAW